MATNKRDLRAYVRYDGNQRIIPGSLVLRRSKPKVGDWKEIQTYECCDGGGCSDVPITVRLRYSVIECEGVSSPADYIILCCNGKLTINTAEIPSQPVPDGYYYNSDGSNTYIVENSIVVGPGSVCS